ncbi:TPA: hypothetical protein DCR79_00140 [Patescibacteria group bacterium]|nr:hypothetical protein [Patescibacteria group bacterium]
MVTGPATIIKRLCEEAADWEQEVENKINHAFGVVDAARLTHVPIPQAEAAWKVATEDAPLQLAG